MGYLAPEVLESQMDDFSRDVWALGCVLFNAMCKKSPFSGANRQELRLNILESDPRLIPPFYSSNITKLTLRLLTKDPIHRPTMKSIIRQFKYLRKKIRYERIRIHENIEEIIDQISFPSNEPMLNQIPCNLGLP